MSKATLDAALAASLLAASGADATVVISAAVGGAGYANGSPTGPYAAPDISNSNGVPFGDNTVSGADSTRYLTTAANGDQGVNGTYYVNITSSDAFSRIVVRVGSNAFEFENVAYNPRYVPEPGSFALRGMGLAGPALHAPPPTLLNRVSSLSRHEQWRPSGRRLRCGATRAAGDNRMPIMISRR